MTRHRDRLTTTRRGISPPPHAQRAVAAADALKIQSGTQPAARRFAAPSARPPRHPRPDERLPAVLEPQRRQRPTLEIPPLALLNKQRMRLLLVEAIDDDRSLAIHDRPALLRAVMRPAPHLKHPQVSAGHLVGVADVSPVPTRRRRQPRRRSNRPVPGAHPAPQNFSSRSRALLRSAGPR